MRVHPLILLGAACLLGLPATAQTLKPGLWEIHNKSNHPEMAQAMAQMQQQMAALPPEQRKQMEAMMAQQGVRMAPGAGGAMAVQVCMTREMVERNEVPVQDGCRMTQQQRSGNTIRMAFTCSQPPSSGEGQVTIASPEAYSSRMTVRVSDGGKTETTTMEASGRWLQADCGQVRPMAPRR